MSLVAQEGLDLSRFYHPELPARIAELLGLRQRLVTVLKWTALAVVLGVAVTASVFPFRLPWYGLLPLVLYAAVASLAVGILAGLTRCVDHALSEVRVICKLTIDLTQQIGSEVSRLKSGDVQMPPVPELAHDILRQLIWPAVESVVRQKFGWLARPMLWVYRWPLRRVERRLERELSPPTDEPQPAAETPDSAKPGLETSASYDRSLDEWTARAAQTLASLQAGFRWALLGPLYLAVVLAAGLACLPLTATWWWTS